MLAGSDRGRGMDARTLRRLFTPYFRGDARLAGLELEHAAAVANSPPAVVGGAVKAPEFLIDAAREPGIHHVAAKDCLHLGGKTFAFETKCSGWVGRRRHAETIRGQARYSTFTPMIDGSAGG